MLIGVVMRNIHFIPIMLNTANLKSIVNGYHKRIGLLEAEKYDLEYEVAKKDMEVFELIHDRKQSSSVVIYI